ncbi:amidase [Paractinoplanes atraurantiacus]|uniref:Aspartyl-tRNA(Asn)/glutamyl-tRNA(Gln) amidotransferase subunit A n=1 Tax=Paractinoplanes atraurantiacus TaxID=1036182 RepID=A0A285GRG3_9ACTN|nr:amidase family protein [Actinoplanes atraurantiacus]SNY26129.1 aspartyl-tRNA(Asn)/glutamyl-tRNA(Gln) amidotransferase subunit A [Actinoplanes atraurantiacus]
MYETTSMVEQADAIGRGELSSRELTAAYLERIVPDRDATAVRLLKEAGALVLGKTNMHEYSFGITSDNPRFGPVRNPYDPSRIPGGSSGGSGAATAAGLCSAAIGTDTGGSVRIPAALCGVVGLKPTLGRVSTDGVLGLSWTCDVVGPIARTVEDAAALLRVIGGGPAETLQASPLKGVRVGVPGGFYATDNSPDVDSVLARTYKTLESEGAVLVPVTVDGADRAGELGSLSVLPEGAVCLEEALRTAGVPGGLAGNLGRFGADIRSGLTRPIAAAAYAEAVARSIPALRRGFAAALSGVDVLLTATTPTTAIPIAESRSMTHNGRTVDPFATFTRYTAGLSVTGLPALSIPAGFDRAGLPVGVQLIGPRWSEGRLVEIALAMEQVMVRRP